MKIHNNQRLQMNLLATMATLTTLGALTLAFAQIGIGARYGARDPRTCADRTAPKTGAPSVAQATQYFICDAEEVFGDNLYLVDNVKLQVAKGRKYNPNEDINMPGIDTTNPVYPIRGSYQQYQCGAIYPDHTNLNRNCTLYSQPKATGVCYKNDFGDWKCKMVDVDAEKIADNVAPPGAATPKPKPAPVAAKPAQNAPAKAAPQAEKPDAETKNPQPDFSAMEPWYEIVRSEYPTPPDRMMSILFKPKGETRPWDFYVEFRDRDGVLVQSADLAPLTQSSDLMETKIGTTGRVKFQLPPESLMKQVTSVTVVRSQ